MTRNRILQAALAAALIAPHAACEDDLAGPGDGNARATLSFAVPRPGSGAGLSAFPGSAMLVPVRDAAGRTLDIQSVELVIREIELEGEDDECGSDDCAEFETGPVLVTLPVQGGTVSPFATTIPAGVYDELELKIDGPDDDDATDRAFRAAHPEWPRNASVRIRGTFDAGDGAGARPFDLFLGVDAELEQRLSPPLVVDEATDPASVNITILVDVSSWLRRSDGTWYDPRDVAANGSLADRIEEQVVKSLEVFEDEDRDGEEED